ncbi:histidine triad nucleotide-binding protein [Desulfomonile tiedjei]|uniref:HIT family hydrolase, diadenosine tetraphosphate hydrolase n=1 Tax=Desulfomonile tiedjei (strain ATCC 49306 / DSM 6799 / DCB-1) TaxID=706587 RepID=I4C3H3_DESTA|nr:histidine triad nucleotide-binding protein [Desulfomonile tiedjei]AFM24114.1 HIT family hydrolase, diadenosine tetraphosphate hydrolase [Desulfomonile tiedjei DSM 6799]
MTDCIFCNIIARKIPAKIIYEDEQVVAFWDAYPASPIHLLLVPKTHIATFNDIPEEDQILTHIGSVARKITRDLGIAESGYRVFINVNRGGGQVVFHLHAHLVSGKDLGTVFFSLAVAGAILWRKIVNTFSRGKKLLL